MRMRGDSKLIAKLIELASKLPFIPCKLGFYRLCQHNFEHNDYEKHKSIMLA